MQPLFIPITKKNHRNIDEGQGIFIETFESKEKEILVRNVQLT